MVEPFKKALDFDEFQHDIQIDHWNSFLKVTK